MYRSTLFVAAVLVLATAPNGAQAASEAEAWRYVVPALGERHAHPPLTALPLSTEPPADVNATARFRGTHRRYAQLRYGDPDSIRMAIALDHLASGEVDLYVDASRDRSIDPEDLVRPGAAGWVTSLSVSHASESGVELVPHRVLFRLGKTGAIFSYATMGFREGGIELESGRLRVRRMDGDGNGFFSDPRDQLWIDGDGDGRWAAMSELYLYGPILQLAGRRYAVRSDRKGSDLALRALEGTGYARVSLGEPDDAAVRSIHVLFVGRDGSAIGVRAHGEPIELPAGEYRLGMVTVVLADPTAGERDWGFVFSETSARDDARWYEVAKGETMDIDPIGELRFLADLAEGVTYGPGEYVTFSPRLYTADGLLINIAHRGRSESTYTSGLSASVRLSSAAGEPLDQASSGFA